ncbi:MAG TPA: TadE/TadG family type IV pilus assembly protein [Candidatus Acidoferrum sp.]|nr:TadE/TadG family type IV pilus assembly protein [Candidatus Acidoferrum sp.]
MKTLVSVRETKKRGEKGSAMLEFALVTVLLLLLLFGIVDFGRALYTYHFLANASREATRWASVNGQSCITDPTCPNGSPAQETDVQQYVAGLTPPGISKANIQGCDLSNTPNALGVCANWSTAPSLPGTPAVCTAVPKDPGCPVQVTVSYNFGFLVPLVHKGVLQMSSSSETIISH